MANPNPQLEAALAKLLPRATALFALPCVLALSACVTPPPTFPPAKEAATMTTPESNSTTNQKLGVEEIGKRFLKLIEDLNAREALSVERVQEATGLSLERSLPSPGGTVFYTYAQPLDNGWEYVLRYIPESRSNLRGVDLSFVNRTNETADMSPACGLDFEYFHNALKRMGFTDHPVHGEIGQLQSWRYVKFKESDGGVDMEISIIPQNVVAGEESRLCIKSIGTLN
jgi:hypothetical protein